MMITPHFFIIGAMKCATSTLHSQLAANAGITMSVVKEPNFFSNDENYSRGAEWYRGCFPEDIPTDSTIGESSTHYSKLPTYPNTVDRLAAWSSEDVKFVYVIRNPIDRLISHFVHDWTMNKLKGDINEAIYTYSDLIDYSMYGRQIEPFIERFGKNNVHVLAFERIKQEPDIVVRELGDFLGLKHELKWNHQLDAQNVSSHRVRKIPMQSLLIDSKAATFMRRAFFPKAFRDWVRSPLQMKSRPSLSQSSIDYLEEIFIEDFKVFSRVYGLGNTPSDYQSLIDQI